jgi:peptidoglycan/xylan/chitin deacetylase (PgdA/CDA1 family)
MIRLSAAILLAAALALVSVPSARAAEHAVALLYHRFGDDAHPTTNVTLDRFEAHLRILAEGGYTVLPLDEIFDRLQAGEALPDKAVAITIDDADASIYDTAWPRLRAANLPFTVFLETGAVDEGHRHSLTWAQVREMAAAGVAFAPHSVSHAHMTDIASDRAAAELRDSRSRLAEMLGAAPARIFAWPFGEHDARLHRLAREAGYAAAFGQQSGVLHAGADMFALPRFAMTGHFSDIERFRIAVSALPFPVEQLAPADALIRSATPLVFRFRPLPPVTADDAIGCYASGGRAPRLERAGGIVSVTVTRGFAPGRARLNCTLQDTSGRWRWLGRQFTVRDASGRTPPE